MIVKRTDGIGHVSQHLDMKLSPTNFTGWVLLNGYTLQYLSTVTIRYSVLLDPGVEAFSQDKYYVGHGFRRAILFNAHQKAIYCGAVHSLVTMINVYTAGFSWQS